MSTYKANLLQKYLNEYTDENRFNFCKLALRKYRFEKYRMGSKNTGVEIAPEDRIVNDNNVRALIQSVVDKGECSVEDFNTVFDALRVDQIEYIGF